MDRLGATHLKIIQQERERYLEKRYWNYLASKAQHEKRLDNPSVQGLRAGYSPRVLLRVSSVSLLLVFAVCVTLFLIR
jgi:hypothetical protein